MRALGAHIQEGICSALSLLAHDAQKLCLLLGAIWQLAARTDVLDSERLAPLLLQQLEQPVSEVVAGRKAVYMTLGGLLALKRDGWAASAMALRALMGCVVRCQDTGDEESLEVALTLVCRRARDLLEFVHDAVPVETLRALVRGLAAFKERPLQMTLLQVTLLVNVGVRVKPGEALADAMGSMEMIGALLRIAQRALRVKESPSIALLRHGVCRLVNTWLLVSSERTKLADDESSVKIMVDFVTRQVGWSQASEQEFCATECLLNMHRWLCETGRFAELEAVSARLVINRLRFSEHERSFRSVTDRVRTPKEYSGLIANGAVSALLKGVEQRSSRHKMRGFMQMLIGCVASVSKEAHGLNESVPKSILRLLARQSTEHEDKQALLCALMMACRNAAFPSQVADPEEELLPVLVHCLRFFVHDFSDPFFEVSFVSSERISLHLLRKFADDGLHHMGGNGREQARRRYGHTCRMFPYATLPPAVHHKADADGACGGRETRAASFSQHLFRARNPSLEPRDLQTILTRARWHRCQTAVSWFPPGMYLCLLSI